MSSAKATKKSAFSCEPCRRRKVSSFASLSLAVSASSRRLEASDFATYPSTTPTPKPKITTQLTIVSLFFARQVKCGGEQPMCQRCTSRNDECVYKLNPTLSYTQRLEKRIKELEDQLASASRSPPSITASAHSSPSTASTGLHDGRSPPKSHPDEQSFSRSFSSLTVDDKGRITFGNGASANDRPASLHSNGFYTSAELDQSIRERLVANAMQQRALETFSATPEPFQYLLNVHWCWIQPLFMFIYRPAFTRDMQTMGQYYSHMLLNALMSHSVNWGRNDPTTRLLLDDHYGGGEIFGKHARSMLFEDMRRGACTIPMVQTLLLLSSEECAFGNTIQAWTYSGLAFRLMDQIGVCFDGQRYPGSVPLNEEDIEIRRRIFWSSYFWDKMLSLYMGRMPTLHLTPASPPLVMYDDSAENEPWQPFGMPPDGRTWNYPASTAHSATCFIAMIRLSLIFNEILLHMYDPVIPNTETEMLECLAIQGPALDKWWDDFPPYLKMDAANLPAIGPPTHLFTSNCIFHTYKILLYRPMLTRQYVTDFDGQLPWNTYLINCVTSATATIAIFDLFARTYSIKYCALSISYSMYIAASVFLLQVQAMPSDSQAMRRLDYCLHMLHRVMVFNPIIGRSTDFILKELVAIGISFDVVAGCLVETTSRRPLAPQNRQLYQRPLESTTELAAQSSTHALFYSTIGDDFGTGAVHPDVYHAMIGLEPVTVRFCTLDD
ncbi:fungal specific transcription factor [Beauveria bassiana ARSEF 2860]|uniref:Fungal specific transcription factor n=1 Tax=Beauveria bassiana (strain ARSEF 2860) TaxID=655819 RepID=J4UM45_BEAB2|nr:fungal specific transcription factor [Beauveria bassiana ARSEF 2860]EJP65812.1 fungal specific transcription factor [Beauveria bassiana ARSEF 2860]